jgi:DNA-binding winged helix-turn-helix (wHTH) protein
MEPVAVNSVYRFEGFVLDLARGALLTTIGEEIPLRRKSFELLRLLVKNAGRLLDRDTINQAIWPDVTVGDDGITQCIGDIRRALGDDAQHIPSRMNRNQKGFSLSFVSHGCRECHDHRA